MKRVIGIMGGVGSGKSQILSILETEYQAQVIQADLVAAELEQPGQEGLRLLAGHFGRGILGKDGALDRKAFADMVFQDPQALAAVNDIIHPLVYGELERRVAAGTAPVIAVEAALFTAKNRGPCQEMWFVDTSEENRVKRLMENRGYTRGKCLDIIRSQPSREDFMSFADQVIDNNGTICEAQMQVSRLMGG